MATNVARAEPATKVQEAVSLARTIVDTMDKGKGVAASLRQCERLADLTDDEFMKAYASRALQPGLAGDSEKAQADLDYVSSRRDAKASGIFQYMRDFQVRGEPIGEQIKRRGQIKWQTLRQSLPEAETFVTSARKSTTYKASEQGLIDSLETNEAVIEKVRNRLYRYASSTLNRLLFEHVPEYVLDATRRKVDSALTKISPKALERFATAYEELRGSSSENWTNACLGVRRVLLAFADSVFPAQDDLIDGREVGQEQYVNRLWAHARRKIASDSRRAMVLAEVTDLGHRIDAIYESSNKGVHDVVTKDEAERIIARAYFLIADLL